MFRYLQAMGVAAFPYRASSLKLTRLIALSCACIVDCIRAFVRLPYYVDFDFRASISQQLYGPIASNSTWTIDLHL
jgi:hypothetical protein